MLLGSNEFLSCLVYQLEEYGLKLSVPNSDMKQTVRIAIHILPYVKLEEHNLIIVLKVETLDFGVLDEKAFQNQEGNMGFFADWISLDITPPKHITGLVPVVERLGSCGQEYTLTRTEGIGVKGGIKKIGYVEVKSTSGQEQRIHTSSIESNGGGLKWKLNYWTVNGKWQQYKNGKWPGGGKLPELPNEMQDKGARLSFSKFAELSWTIPRNEVSDVPLIFELKLKSNMRFLELRKKSWICSGRWSHKAIWKCEQPHVTLPDLRITWPRAVKEQLMHPSLSN